VAGAAEGAEPAGRSSQVAVGAVDGAVDVVLLLLLGATRVVGVRRVRRRGLVMKRLTGRCTGRWT